MIEKSLHSTRIFSPHGWNQICSLFSKNFFVPLLTQHTFSMHCFSAISRITRKLLIRYIWGRLSVFGGFQTVQNPIFSKKIFSAKLGFKKVWIFLQVRNWHTCLVRSTPCLPLKIPENPLKYIFVPFKRNYISDLKLCRKPIILHSKPTKYSPQLIGTPA